VDTLIVAGSGPLKHEVSALLDFLELFANEKLFLGSASSRSFCSLLFDKLSIDELCSRSGVAPC